MMSKFLLRRLREPGTLRRIFLERLTEPIHLNLLSAFALFGSLRTKVDFDLIVRQHTAYGLLKAADNAKELGVDIQGSSLSKSVSGGPRRADDHDLQRRVIEVERHIRESRLWLIALISAGASIVSAITARVAVMTN